MELHQKENSRRDKNANKYVPEVHRLPLKAEQAGCARDSLSLPEDAKRCILEAERLSGRADGLSGWPDRRVGRPDERFEYTKRHWNSPNGPQ